MITDERAGLPSAANFERLAACPGSWWWAKQAPEAEEAEETEDAATGTRIHAYLAGEITADKLTEEEMHTATACDSAAWEFLRSRGLTPEDPIHKERRFWFEDLSASRIFSGKADLFARKGARAAIIDYKTGRGDVAPAPENLQLRALVACVACEELLSSVEVAIVQPWASPRVTVATYDGFAIGRAIAEALEIVRRATTDEGKTTVAGDHCKYCPAKGLCPATKAAVQSMALTTSNKTSRELMTPADKLAFWKACNLAIEIAESFRAHVKRALEEDPGCIPGLTLKPGAVRTKVVDVSTLFQRMNQRFGVAGDEFANACSITKTDLKELTRSATGKKGKELDATVAELCEGIVEEKQTAPSVEEVKS